MIVCIKVLIVALSLTFFHFSNRYLRALDADNPYPYILINIAALGYTFNPLPRKITHPHRPQRSQHNPRRTEQLFELPAVRHCIALLTPRPRKNDSPAELGSRKYPVSDHQNSRYHYNSNDYAGHTSSRAVLIEYVYPAEQARKRAHADNPPARHKDLGYQQSRTSQIKKNRKPNPAHKLISLSHHFTHYCHSF